MRRRYRSARLTNLGDVLQKELKKRGFPVQIDDRQLKGFWEEAVGPVIAAQTRLESRKKDTLNVIVSSSVWMQQLHFMRTEIIEKVNHMPGHEPIKDIRFRIGEIRAAQPEKKDGALSKIGRTAPLRERDKRMIEETTASLQDPELKELLKRVMLKEISRRRLIEKQIEKGRRK
jgi:predicted nucleic acid-binding Zn ribbon protein